MELSKLRDAREVIFEVRFVEAYSLTTCTCRVNANKAAVIEKLLGAACKALGRGHRLLDRFRSPGPGSGMVSCLLAKGDRINDKVGMMEWLEVHNYCD